MQAEASALQQELQGLRCSAAQAEKQLQGDITSLQGQLAMALSASDQETNNLRGQLGQQPERPADADRQMNALKDRLKVAAAESDRRLSVMKGELETAQAECAKATQLEGQFDRTLKDSKTTQEQRDAAYKAWQAAEVCPSPATLTFSDLAVNHLLCPSLRQCMRLCVTLCTPFTKLWSVAKLPWGFSVALLQSVDAQTACRVPRSAPCAAGYGLQVQLPYPCSC